MSKLDDFKTAINGKRKILITFVAKDGQRFIAHKCAPLDFGPNPNAKDKTSRFHAWDYESDAPQHEISLYPNHIQKVEILTETFDPKEVVAADLKANTWFYERDWGIYS